MNFFGMGMWEITVILIAALIIFGPGKLPEVAGQVGRTVRDFRRMTTDLTSEFEQTPGVKELRNEIAGIKSEITGASEGVKREMSSAAKTVNASVSSAKTVASSKKTTGATTTAAKKSTTSAKTSTTSSTAAKTTTKSAAKSKAVASKADPLADVSFLDESAGESRPSAVGDRTGAPVANAPQAPPATAAAPVAPASPHGPDDALARARRRRQQAGYGRPRA